MANKKTKKTKIIKRKYPAGESNTGTLQKPEGWTDKLFQTWLSQRTLLARRLVINEARAVPKNFADPDGSIPDLLPLPATVDGLPFAVQMRAADFYDKQQKEREAWLARIKLQEIEEAKRQAARVEKLRLEREANNKREANIELEQVASK